jgi:hypothetical protein
MTLVEFLRHVKKLHDAGFHRWFYQDEPSTIRFTHRNFPEKVFCPITAVTYMLTGKYFNTNEYFASGVCHLQLDTPRIVIIISASDWSTECPLRRALLRAVSPA